MPSATLVAQAGISLPWPSTETRQMRQLPTIGSLGYQQRAGISIAAFRGASRMGCPSFAVNARPSIFTVGPVCFWVRLASRAGRAIYQRMATRKIDGRGFTGEGRPANLLV